MSFKKDRRSTKSGYVGTSMVSRRPTAAIKERDPEVLKLEKHFADRLDKMLDDTILIEERDLVRQPHQTQDIQVFSRRMQQQIEKSVLASKPKFPTPSKRKRHRHQGSSSSSDDDDLSKFAAIAVSHDDLGTSNVCRRLPANPN